MSPQQIEALAELVGAEMDKKMSTVRSRKELDQILSLFAQGAGERTKAMVAKGVAEARDRLLGQLDALEARVAALEKTK